MADSSPSFCSKCGYSVEKTFQFCPKCGIKIRVSSGAKAPESKFSLSKFQSFKAKKELGRSSFFIRGKGLGKRKKEDDMVTINIGLMNKDSSIKRSESLPLKIGSRAGPEEIVGAAVKKHSLFNKRFNTKADYKLVFKDGTEVKHIPGTEESFTLIRYKEESGFGYARIKLYLRGIGDIFEQMQKSLDDDTISIDSGELSAYAGSSGDENMKPAFIYKSCSTRSGSSGDNVVPVPSSSDPAKPSTSHSMFVDCPTCWASFPITEIEEHADVCAQTKETFTDPHPSCSTSDQDREQLGLKEEILSLGESMGKESTRITVRRKQLWADFVRARSSTYSPSQGLKVTFCGEPAVDGGGPKREFFCDMLEYCKKRLFPEGKPKNSVLSLTREEFRLAGEVIAMSIIQGGPAPNFLAPEVYTVISRSFLIENCRDTFLKETCQKLNDAVGEDIGKILLEDKVLDVLQVIGYNGVPTRENKQSVERIIESICMHDQTSNENMTTIFQFEEGLKTYGLLNSVRKYPEMWRPIFTPINSLDISANIILDQLTFNFSMQQIRKEEEIDVHYHFSNYLHSLDTTALRSLLKWATGSSSIPPLGLPRKIAVNFLHGCRNSCRCRPTTSTRDLCITIPSHLNNEDDMNAIMASAVSDTEGFGLI